MNLSKPNELALYLLAQYKKLLLISRGLIDCWSKGSYIHLVPLFKFLTPSIKENIETKKNIRYWERRNTRKLSQDQEGGFQFYGFQGPVGDRILCDWWIWTSKLRSTDDLEQEIWKIFLCQSEQLPFQIFSISLCLKYPLHWLCVAQAFCWIVA